jgi:hypothetical protein
MTIRPDQERTLSAYGRGQFLHSVAGYLRAEHPDAVAVYSDTELDRRVRWGSQKAERFGLAVPADVATFVALLFEISPRFFKQPAIHRILTDPRIPSDKRMQAVIDRTPAAAWDEVAEQNDGWFE